MKIHSSRINPAIENADRAKIEEARKELVGTSAVVDKVTCAGYTTSSTMALEELCRPSLFMIPTNAISSKTIQDASTNFLPVLAHKNCERVRKKLDKDPFLENLQLPLPDCLECKTMNECLVFAARTEWASTTTMTYAKAMALMLNNSAESEEIRDALTERIRVLICDESHIIGRGSGASIEYDESIVIPEEFTGLRRIFHHRFWKLKEEHREQALSLERDHEFLGPHSHLAFKAKNEYPLGKEEMKTVLGELLKFANKRKRLGVTKEGIERLEDAILKLKDVITILSNPTIIVHLIYDDNEKRMKLLISSQTNLLQQSVHDFIGDVIPKATVFFVSGTQFEPYTGFYEWLAGRELRSIVYPDLSNTNASMTIHPDTWTFNPNDSKTFDRVCDHIRKISELVSHQSIYLVTINRLCCNELEERLGKELTNITFDYYRSSNSVGVRLNKKGKEPRICIAVGAAEVPVNAFDPIAQTYLDSQRIRLLYVHADTWQSWSRVKDPLGMEPSTVFCIGIRKQKVSDIVTWGTNRRVIVAEEHGRLTSKVECDEHLSRPNVAMENRSDTRPSQRTVDDYIDAIIPIGEDCLNRVSRFYVQKTADLLYYNTLGSYSKSYDFCTTPLGTYKFRFHNNRDTPEKLEETLLALGLFISRTDKCGLQWHQPNAAGEWGYFVGSPSWEFSDLMRMHLGGKETLCLPPFNLEDICYFCAVDFDDHLGYMPQGENVMKFSQFLYSKGIPHIVVRSGTNDGYHVFIPLEPAKTFVAWKFIRQLIKDAGLGKVKEIETYPKQKSVQTSRGG
ncbi:MAG: hypothetical protein MUO26_04290, partial [Methanotrichaceae archaeon]|nr:hypothetical protein [Methanotrichaceae archaeon]